MKAKIHYEKSGIEDWFTLYAANIEELQAMAKIECDKRGLTEKENNLWSEVTEREDI